MADPIPRFSPATGVVNGVNRDFLTPTPYVENTLAVFINGALMRGDYDDGWAETAWALGAFRLKIAPREGDTVQAFYIDTKGLDIVTVYVPEEVQVIRGLVQVEPKDLITARVAPVSGEPIQAVLVQPLSSFSLQAVTSASIVGTITPVQQVTGQIGGVQCR